MQYINEAWARVKHLQSYFDTVGKYHLWRRLSFFMLYLFSGKNQMLGVHPYTLGIALLPQADRAMAA